LPPEDLKQDHACGDIGHHHNQVDDRAEPYRHIIPGTEDKVGVREHVIVERKYQNMDKSK
jgi:hypothetical protein